MTLSAANLDFSIDDPAKTIHTLAEQESTTALDDYMNTHPEHEEKLVSDRKINEETAKTLDISLR